MSLKHVVQHSVSATPVRLLAVNPARVAVAIRNWSSNPVYLGVDNTVTVRTGFPVTREDGIQNNGIITATDELWAVTGGTAVTDQADVRVFEEVSDGTPATALTPYTVSGPGFSDTRPDPTENAGLLILITNTDPPEIQFSDGTAWQTFAAVTENMTFPSVTTTGGLNVGADLIAEDDVFVAAHFSRVGNTSIVAAAGAGASTEAPAADGPVVAARSTDVAGSLTCGTGGTPTAGELVTVTFGTPFGFVPVVVVTPLNAVSAALGPYVGSVTAEGFSIEVQNAPAATQAHTVYAFSYLVIG
jgi:hypothetical protein